MNSLVAILGTALDVLLVLAGFSLIIFFHEVGHFVAARWAGVRVLAFAMGLGSAAVSYRRGMGFRRGSSEREYLEIARRTPRGKPLPVGHTEYRLNWLPFGGYVKMLGQDDLDPGATSTEPDSYQSAPVWKRMIVISAGVVVNMLVAAALFIIVFMVGLRTEPPKVGGVVPESRAALAQAVNAEALGVVEPGLRAGDRLLLVNGRRPNSFNDLILGVVMARRGDPVEIDIQRAGLDAPLRFRIVPEVGEVSGVLEIGVQPAWSATLASPDSDEEVAQWVGRAERIGLVGLRPGMTLVRVGGNRDVTSAEALIAAVRESGGRPVEAEFVGDDDTSAVVRVTPMPELQQQVLMTADGRKTAVEHLLGLVPVMRIADGPSAVQPRAERQGLMPGDVFARLGVVEYPGVAAGVAQVQASAGKTMQVVVLREGGGSVKELPLSVRIGRDGRIGFSIDDTGRTSTLMARPLSALRYAAVHGADPRAKGAQPAQPRPFAAESLRLAPGTRILEVAGRPVGTMGELRDALRDATAGALASEADAVDVDLLLELPIAAGDSPRVSRRWTLARAEVETLHALGWQSPLARTNFLPEQFTLRAEGPIGAVAMGLSETRRVMLLTYVTFARLFEGTVRVEHLKGPVGITHLGARLADRGVIWLLFFMGLVSVNLAVINFLPLPIVDGGQFLFLLAEAIRGRPVPIAIQNVATVAGVLLIGAIFIIVTLNDIATLFGG